MEVFPAIALVTDDSVLASAIPAQLRHRYATEVTCLTSWPQFRDLLATNPPSLAILDLHYCQDILPELKAVHAAHPRMLMLGIAQADGYAESGIFSPPLAQLLPRPLSIPLLMHHLSLLHKRQSLATQQQELSFTGGIALHPMDKAILTASGERIDLTDKEAALLTHLYRHRAEWLPREALLEAVWGYDGSIDTHTLETHLYRLRSKLRPLWNETEPVLTQHSSYRLNPELTASSGE